ncbi:DNA polymerase III subunit delta [Helicobacter sp. 11S02629-2]|uniref:DNA polymerase III subunit delta n=1 Tax=Helicobacter sp. 11S02629-2 TaxID=1476195 RepID=UPI000BA7C611|nr:DNA polymerase III subunit delta [Helicobacter sp. 11S02629-2]PAF45411.1 hypothetical protein BKH40_02785 [Helicobacter sp. 11S02629-2]
MYKQDLDKYLQTKIPKAIFLYGESEFYISHYGELIASKIGGEVNRIYFDNNFNNVLNLLSGASLFGDTNIVLLRTYNTIPSNTLKQILSSIEDKSFLIVEFYKNPSISDTEYAKRYRSMGTTFKLYPNCLEVRFFAPTFNEGLYLLRDKAKKLGLEVHANALEFLLEVQNNDIGIALNELEKFAIDKKITSELVEKLSYGIASLNIEALINALFDGENIALILEKLEEEGIEEMDLLREVQRHFYILFKLYAYSKAFGRLDYKEALGYTPPPKVAEGLSRRALRLKSEQFVKILDTLSLWRIDSMRGVANSKLINLSNIKFCIDRM